MRKTVITCNVCKDEIPIVKKKDIFGIEREFYRFGQLELGDSFNIDTTRLGIDLCEKCAGKISLEMQEAKFKILLNAGCLK